MSVANSEERETASERYERIAQKFYDDTGFMARGKSMPPELWYDGYDEERDAAWDKWIIDNRELFALPPETGS